MSEDEDEDIRVIRIPPSMFGEMWPHVAPFLLVGIAAAEGDIRQLGDDLVRDHAQLWAIFEDDRVRAAFLTSVRFDDQGERYVDLYSLAGEGAPRWGKALTSAVEEFAEDEGAKRVIFCGKEGWSRVLPNYRITGEKKPGVLIFERAM